MFQIWWTLGGYDELAVGWKQFEWIIWYIVMYFLGGSVKIIIVRASDLLWIHVPPWTLAGVVCRVHTESWILKIVLKFAQ